jgi:beta-galactosidase
MRALLFGLLVLWMAPASPAESGTNLFLSALPDGYYLQSYDDCGVAGRQPHVLMKDCYLWTFNTSDTDAGPKERSAVFSYKGIQAVYTNLNPQLSYVLALTYASDHVYHRVQSLEANGVVLHGPYPLPQAKATRLIVRVPPEVTREGKMTLAWKIHGEVNATVSIIELWANAPATNSLHITSLAGLTTSLQGQVVDLAYDPVSAAQVSLGMAGVTPLATTQTTAAGTFRFSRAEVEATPAGTPLVLSVRGHGTEGQLLLNRSNLFFDPVHYRPLPAKTASLATNCLLLDGTWVLNPAPTNTPRAQPLTGSGWASFQVPGQWLQQGFQIPPENPVAVARQFLIPKAWAGQRIILRFDAVHAGTHYWLNGRELGYSENLFTPVEWDITDAALPGQTNRLDLEMKVATVSEALSYSSAYAFHNLGGIDRSVRVFALPTTHISQLHLDAGLDQNYRNGELRLQLLLNHTQSLTKDLSLAIKLQDENGKVVKHSLGDPQQKPSSLTVAAVKVSNTLDLIAYVPAPQPWSAEKPNLYRLTLELRQGAVLLERIQRDIGFRKIEIRGSQLYVNGQRIKLAGACHHEFDPLTGRANTARHAETDVRLLKAANLNYLRTSHYPPTAELLEAADRLGLYVEVEAPFCWVGGALDNPTNLIATLTPTSAMVDYHHAHPSVLVWSLANESHFNLQFLASARLGKELDPTRPTTFNHDFANSPLAAVTDIANWHYPPWPFNTVFAGDSRPLYFGEYFFPVCHEQTDVALDPGLRELWGQGQAEPDSAFARACAKDFEKPPLKPGLQPGGWSAMVHSSRVIGGSIWASHDEAFYFSATNHAGYAWHHGFWGLIDYWRRPKPEWFLARHIFSPVWLETRHVAWTPGSATVRVPVENRYAFTDFSELKFDWALNGHHGRLHPHLAPGESGELEIPLPRGTAEGDPVALRVTTPAGALIEETVVQLGKERPTTLPRPSSGPLHQQEEQNLLVLQGKGFAVVFDRTKGEFVPTDPRHKCAAIAFPAPHVTRYDFGDLNGPKSPPYAIFPQASTRQVEQVEVQEEPAGLRLVVHDRYQFFTGKTSWLIDQHGRGVVSCDYTYSGPAMDTREAGIRLLVKPACDELKWRRWSEWGVFPEESLSRTAGSAKARRPATWGPAQWNHRPAWPWSLDETAQGTADFRGVKFNIYEAALAGPDGSGLTLHAQADAHFRAALTPEGVAAYLLWRCPLGQVSLKPGDHLQGEFVLELRPPRK